MGRRASARRAEAVAHGWRSCSEGGCCAFLRSARGRAPRVADPLRCSHAPGAFQTHDSVCMSRPPSERNASLRRCPFPTVQTKHIMLSSGGHNATAHMTFRPSAHAHRRDLPRPLKRTATFRSKVPRRSQIIRPWGSAEPPNCVGGAHESPEPPMGCQRSVHAEPDPGPARVVGPHLTQRSSPVRNTHTSEVRM